MRWKIDKRVKPANGQREALRRFALWPTFLENGEVVWLEHYVEHRLYVETIGRPDTPTDNKWVTLRRTAPEKMRA